MDSTLFKDSKVQSDVHQHHGNPSNFQVRTVSFTEGNSDRKKLEVKSRMILHPDDRRFSSLGYETAAFKGTEKLHISAS